MHARVILGLFIVSFSLAVQAAGPDPARRAQLIHMVREDCGSCHGMTLKGGLGPSLLPSALAGKADDSLEAVILDGRPGTPMPPWRAIAMAIRDSVTVSMAADTSGRLRRISRVRRVPRSTSRGRISE